MAKFDMIFDVFLYFITIFTEMFGKCRPEIFSENIPIDLRGTKWQNLMFFWYFITIFADVDLKFFSESPLIDLRGTKCQNLMFLHIFFVLYYDFCDKIPPGIFFWKHHHVNYGKIWFARDFFFKLYYDFCRNVSRQYFLKAR